MNRFWLKIAGLVVVVVIIIAGVYLLWPKTPNSRQAPKERTSVLAAQPKRQLKPEDFQWS
jgi:type IV secretory pathway VirB10-like protein